MKLDRFMHGLRGSTDWRAAQAELANRLSSRPEEAFAVAAALDEDLADRGYDIAVYSVRRAVFEIACRSPRSEATTVAIRLGAQAAPEPLAGFATEHRRSRNAMELVGTRPATQISDALERQEGGLEQDSEFGLLLIHELVLRREHLPSNADLYRDWAHRSQHPLASLPLGLLDIERDFEEALPRYSASAQGSASWSAATSDQREYGPLQDLLPGVGARTTADTSAIRAPFQEWLEHSNGRVQIDAYGAGPSYPSDLPDPRLHDGRAAALVSPAAALAQLFTAAIGGGAYSQGPGGAYSRLRVWTAVAALVERPWPSVVDHIAELARQLRWIELRTDDHWFGDVAWDIWLVTDDGQRVVAIAATDTD